MSETTPRLSLPLIAAGQAQKEIAHNEAIALLEQLALPVAETIGDGEPPVDVSAGRCWIVGGAPTGAWAGRAGTIACMTAGGWRFVNPQAGMTLWVEGEDCAGRFDGSVWRIGIMSARSIEIDGRQVVSARQPAIAAPEGGASADTEARAAIAAILEVMRNHGLIEA